MCLYPIHYFGAQTAWPGAFTAQGGQINDDINRATDQMAMRRAMIPLTDFQPVLAAKAMVSCHVTNV